MRARSWWAVLAAVVVAWLVAAVLRVSTYSESTDRPSALDPAVVALPVVAIVVLVVALVLTSRREDGDAPPPP